MQLGLFIHWAICWRSGKSFANSKKCALVKKEKAGSRPLLSHRLKSCRAIVQKRENEIAYTIWMWYFLTFVLIFNLFHKNFFRLSINAHTIVFSDSFVRFRNVEMGFSVLEIFHSSFLWAHWRNFSTCTVRCIAANNALNCTYELYIENENGIKSIETLNRWAVPLLVVITFRYRCTPVFQSNYCMKFTFFPLSRPQIFFSVLSGGTFIAGHLHSQRYCTLPIWTIETLIFYRNWIPPIYFIIHSIEISDQKCAHARKHTLTHSSTHYI